MLKRSGEIYEQSGRRQQALAHYRSFVHLMKNADAELQPQVRDVAARIMRLEKEDNRNR